MSSIKNSVRQVRRPSRRERDGLRACVTQPEDGFPCETILQINDSRRAFINEA
jgi:hypothetical protein